MRTIDSRDDMWQTVGRVVATGIVACLLGFLVWCLLPKPPAILVAIDQGVYARAADGYVISYDSACSGTNSRPDILTDAEAVEKLLKPWMRSEMREEFGKVPCMDIFTNAPSWQAAKRRLSEEGISVSQVRIDPESAERIKRTVARMANGTMAAEELASAGAGATNKKGAAR